MNAMRWTAIALVILIGTAAVRAQSADAGRGSDEPAPPAPAEILTAPTLPPGSYASPWCGDRGCTGPVGGNGPLTYEIYSRVGPSIATGGSELATALKTGIDVGGGARTLWFNRSSTAAWAFDFGLTYTHNEGQADQTRTVATPRTSPITNDVFGNPSGGERIFPDGLADYRVRGLARTNFNFAIGRDWWLRGPGSTQSESAPNFRVGTDVGGRWGTAHVDLVPRANPDNYLKRTGVIHGVFIGMHCNWERPVGAWILTTGVRAEWGYTITNLVPPLGGDIHDINLLFTVGARF